MNKAAYLQLELKSQFESRNEVQSKIVPMGTWHFIRTNNVFSQEISETQSKSLLYLHLFLE